MKINFDSLFKESSPTIINQQLFKKFLSFDPAPISHKISDNSFKTTDTIPNTLRGSALKDAETIRSKLQFEIEAILQSNSVQKDSDLWKKKKKIDINKLSERMYHAPPCNRKQCQQFQLEKKNKQLMQNEAAKKHNHPKTISQYVSLNKNKVRVHQRLYHDGKIKQLKRQQKVKQNHQKRMKYLKKTDYQVQSNIYLQKYVPFYERLDSIVSKSQERKNFLADNPYLEKEASSKYLIPSFKTNKYKDISSRYSKQVSPRQNYSFQDLNENSSLNTSFQSIMSLDRSIEIVGKIERYFFNRMKCIFVKEGSNLIDISEQNIKLLSDVEFKVIQGFIMQLQQNPLTDQQFIQKLQKYYQLLNFRDKQELRNHEAKLKKYFKLQQFINSKKHDPNDSKILIQIFKQRKKNQNPNRYFQKLQKFV